MNKHLCEQPSASSLEVDSFAFSLVFLLLYLSLVLLIFTSWRRVTLQWCLWRLSGNESPLAFCLLPLPSLVPWFFWWLHTCLLHCCGVAQFLSNSEYASRTGCETFLLPVAPCLCGYELQTTRALHVRAAWGRASSYGWGCSGAHAVGACWGCGPCICGNQHLKHSKNQMCITSWKRISKIFRKEIKLEVISFLLLRFWIFAKEMAERIYFCLWTLWI